MDHWYSVLPQSVCVSVHVCVHACVHACVCGYVEEFSLVWHACMSVFQGTPKPLGWHGCISVFRKLCRNTRMACVHVCVSGTCAKTLGVHVCVSGNSAETFGGACDPEQHDPGGHHALLHHSESSYTPCTH